MKNQKKRIFTLAVTCALVISALMAAIPTANAANRQVYAFLSVAPSPIGIDQTAFVVMWLDSLPPVYSNGTQTVWEKFTLTIVTPSGQTQTLGPFNSDAVASAYVPYKAT